MSGFVGGPSSSSKTNTFTPNNSVTANGDNAVVYSSNPYKSGNNTGNTKWQIGKGATVQIGPSVEQLKEIIEAATKQDAPTEPGTNPVSGGTGTVEAAFLAAMADRLKDNVEEGKPSEQKKFSSQTWLILAGGAALLFFAINKKR
jgi:hypothetical protein